MDSHDSGTAGARPFGDARFSDLSAGTRIAGYEIEGPLGSGGMAIVYRAHDLRLHRPVAIKILAPELSADDDFRRRFVRESKAAAAVDHPNIVPVYDAGEVDGLLYIAMRFVDGHDLKTLLRQRGPLAPDRVAAIITQVASALDAAHRYGLVHRDVKPANILLTAGGDGSDHAYLSDFGVTKMSLAETGITTVGQIIGTLDYAAPEQIEGRQVDARTDVYGLGCTAFEVLCGSPPFERAHDLALLWAQLAETPPPLTSRRPDLPPAVDDVVAKALAKAPDMRYATCLDFAAEFRQALLGRATARAHPATEVVSSAPMEYTPTALSAPIAPETAQMGTVGRMVPVAATGHPAVGAAGGAGGAGPPDVPAARRRRRLLLVIAGIILVAGAIGTAVALDQQTASGRTPTTSGGVSPPSTPSHPARTSSSATPPRHGAGAGAGGASGDTSGGASAAPTGGYHSGTYPTWRTRSPTPTGTWTTTPTPTSTWTSTPTPTLSSPSAYVTPTATP